MKLTKHTPGPWSIAANFHQTGKIVTESGDQIAYIPNFRCFEDAKPNATLIAAAPEMLEALEILQSSLECPDIQRLETGQDVFIYYFEQDTLNQVKAIIAKARGES